MRVKTRVKLMFHNETAFILGAGASRHYGYPTGEELIDEVTLMADRLSAFLSAIRDKVEIGANAPFSGTYYDTIPFYIISRTTQGRSYGIKYECDTALDECNKLVSRLRTVKPLVIDYFLGWNKSLREIGKLMIAAVILKCDADRRKRKKISMDSRGADDALLSRFGSVDLKKQDWIRFIVHKIVYGCEDSNDILKNRVHFVTFNYDSSLERSISEALKSIDLFNEADVEEFLSEGRIIHVYGAVGGENVTDEEFQYTCGQNYFSREWLTNRNAGQPRDLFDIKEECDVFCRFINLAYAASRGIRTINLEDKDEEASQIENAKQHIAGSRVVYILGYGFDDENSKRIGLECLLSQPKRCIMFTNFGDINAVNKKVSKLLYGGYGSIGSGSFVSGDPLNYSSTFVEKSIRNVYDALAYDFYSFEFVDVWKGT